MTKRIAFVMPSLKKGGGNRLFLYLLEKYFQEGFICHVFYLDFSNIEPFALPSFVKKSFIKIDSENIWLIIFSMMKLSLEVRQSKDLNLVIVSDPIQAIFSIIYNRVKVFRYVQSDDKNLFNFNLKANTLLNIIYKSLFFASRWYKYEKILFNSTFSKKSYLGLKTIKDNTNVVFPCSTEHNLESATSGRSKSIVSVLSSHKRKGLGDFIRIANSKEFNDYKFTVISQENLKLPDHIKIVKPSTDKEYLEVMLESSFFLSLSKFEGFSLPPLEAMSLGLVVIAYPNEGIISYCNDNNAILNDLDDTFALNQIIEKLLSQHDKYNNLSIQSLRTATKYSKIGFQNKFYKLVQ